MQIVEAGVQLATEVSGDGPPVLLVHGIAEDRRAWRPIPHARTIAYDRRWYGDSAKPLPASGATVSEHAEDAAALLDALDARGAVGCGRDLGALIVLDLLLRHPGALRAAVLIDPSAFPLVAEATEALSGEAGRYYGDWRDRGFPGAIERWRSGRGRPRDAAFEAMDAIGPNTDMPAQSTLELTRRRLRTIDVPVTILVTPTAPAFVRAAGEALAPLIAGAGCVTGEDPEHAISALLA